MRIASLLILFACAGAPAEKPGAKVAQVIWIASDTDNECNVIAVGDRAALFWMDDSAGTTGIVDMYGRVVAREVGRIGVEVVGELPAGTRAVPTYVHSHQKPPGCPPGRPAIREQSSAE